jgi:hypothetical protein
MKQGIVLGLISATILFTNISYADYSFRLNNPEECTQLSGIWSGKGSASSWFLGQCNYHGTGTISTVDDNGNFSVQVNVDKDSGSPLCPPHATEQLNAVCKGGIVTIKTEFGNLKGTFTPTNGNASGTLSVSPGLEADVSIQMHR